MTSPATPTVLHSPSAQQWEIVRERDAHLLVAAGAGTGKTTTVVTKILYLLGVPVNGQVHPEPLRLRDVAAITYTNKAAAELKEKLRAALRAAGRRDDAYEVDTARVGTIHSFCGEVLGEFALRSGRSPALSLLAEGESAVLCDEVVADTLLEAVEANAVEGLDALLTENQYDHVQGWVRTLVGTGARLATLADTGAKGHERTLLTLASHAHAALNARLAASGQMDFDRMITWTRDLLRDDPAARRALRRRIRVLFVDEFQDVDPVQREIAYLLGDPQSRDAGTTRLVLVGDPKQSIYRFRRADVTVWSAVERDFVEGGLGRLLPLSQSRRSTSAVLAFVDHAIGALLDRPVDGASRQPYEVAYAPISATRSDAPAHAGVELLVVDGEDGGKASADAMRAAEARALAARARELHEGHGVAWRDMAVLLASWSGADTYVAALRAARIPVYALRATGFWELREVLDACILLDAVCDVTDDRALMGVLRGPFVGVTDETLLRIARTGAPPYWPLLGEVAVPEAEERERLARGVALLEELRALRDRVPVRELLQLALDRSGYLAHLWLFGEEGRQRVANVRKLVALARANPGVSVAEFLEVVRRERALDVREGEARLHGERDDVVTVTSVHSAKGLEWGVVFWCDTSRKPHRETPRLLVGEGHIVLGEEGSAAERSAAWQELDARITAEQQAESKRLWYVAATRAKDLLVVGGIAGAKVPKGSPAEAIVGVLPSLDAPSVHLVAADGRTYEAKVRRCVAGESDGEAPAVDAPLLPLEAVPLPRDRVAAASGRTRLSATQIMAHERCGRRHWLRYVMGLREPRHHLPWRGGAEEMDAIARGLIVHDVLEHHEPGADVDELLEAAIGRWDADAPAPESSRGARYRGRLRAEVASAVANPEYAAVAARPGARRELPFLHVLPTGVAVEGAMDLVAPSASGAGYDVIDVKTGAVADEEAARRKAEQYAVQRDVYTSALEAIGGRPVESFSLLFAAAGMTRSPAAARSDVMDRVAAMHDPPAMAKSAGECRFCGFRSAGWCAGVESGVSDGVAQPA